RAILDGERPAFDVAELTQPLPEAMRRGRIERGMPRHQEADPRRPSNRLRLGGERRGEEAARHSREKRSSVHGTVPGFFSGVSGSARVSRSRASRAAGSRWRVLQFHLLADRTSSPRPYHTRAYGFGRHFGLTGRTPDVPGVAVEGTRNATPTRTPAVRFR